MLFLVTHQTQAGEHELIFGVFILVELLLLDDNRNYSFHLVPTSPRDQGWDAGPGQTNGQSRSAGPHCTQGRYTNTGQTMVSPGQLVPISPGGRTPLWDRQWSVPDQLVPPSTEGTAV